MAANPTFKSQMPWEAETQRPARADASLASQQIARKPLNVLPEDRSKTMSSPQRPRRSAVFPQEAGQQAAFPSNSGGGRRIHPNSQGLWHDLPAYACSAGQSNPAIRDVGVDVRPKEPQRNERSPTSESRERYFKAMNSPMAEAPLRRLERLDSEAWARKLAEMRHDEDPHSFRESKIHEAKAQSDQLQRSPSQSQARRVLLPSDFANTPLIHEESSVLAEDVQQNSIGEPLMPRLVSAKSILALLSPSAALGPRSDNRAAASVLSTSKLRLHPPHENDNLVGDASSSPDDCRSPDSDVLTDAQRQLEEWLSFKAKYGDEILQLLRER